MNLQSYLNEAATRQRGYHSVATNMETNEFRIEMIGHLMEEAAELRQLIPRKFWKNEEPMNKEEALEEYADVFLIWAALAAYMGFTAAEVESAISAKISKNSARADHHKPAVEGKMVFYFSEPDAYGEAGQTYEEMMELTGGKHVPYEIAQFRVVWSAERGSFVLERWSRNTRGRWVFFADHGCDTAEEAAERWKYLLLL